MEGITRPGTDRDKTVVCEQGCSYLCEHGRSVSSEVEEPAGRVGGYGNLAADVERELVHRRGIGRLAAANTEASAGWLCTTPPTSGKVR